MEEDEDREWNGQKKRERKRKMKIGGRRKARVKERNVEGQWNYKGMR